MDSLFLSSATLCQKRQQALRWCRDHRGAPTLLALQAALAVTPEALAVILDSPAFRVGYGVVVLSEQGELAALALPATVRFCE